MKRENPINTSKSAGPVKVRPILKWAGGKQQLLPHLLPRVPGKYNKYIEPFIGGGALYFALAPEKAVICDSNPELTHVYQTTADDVERLILRLKKYKTDTESFYKERARNRNRLRPVGRAARTIYLNKTCFNGLYRVNRAGQFNVPYGRYKNPNVCREEELRAASLLLKTSTIVTGDYQETLKRYAEKGDFIFIDPPYMPVSKYADFKRYTKEQFYEADHAELAKEVKRLHGLGCHLLITHSNHPLIHDLYKEFEIHIFPTRRNISKDGKNRIGEDVIIDIPPV